MTFDWLHFLEFANHLMDKKNQIPYTEACYRTIVSRAYYGVYCTTREHFEKTGKFESYGNDHQNLQDYLLKHPHKSRKKIGNQLKKLHQLRKKADYNKQLDELAVNMASRALAEAKKTANELKSL